MDHLSGLDAAFLYIETPETPMHVGGLNICELPPGYEGDFFEDVKKHVLNRLHLASVFQRKLVNMPFELANPIWVHDDTLDIDYHLRSTVLPRPGSRAQLDKLVGRLHSSLLDRSRPLWEFYVIEGLQAPADAPPGSRHVAFYSKVHHAALDGAGGIALAAATLDVGPIPREVKPPPRRGPTGDALGIAELTGAGLKATAAQVAKLVKTLPLAAGAAIALLRQPGEAKTKGAPKKAASNWFGPKTPINVAVTNQRLFASLSVPLAEIKAIAKGNEVTLNDVVLAICSGALRNYLADRGCVPTEPLLAAVPVSLREAGNTQLNNQVSMMRIGLASTIADPMERLQAIKQASTKSKALTGSVKSVLPTDFPSLGAPWLISGLASLFGRSRLANKMPPIANVAISNVPGPKFALYMAGAKLLTYYPVSIAVHSMALNITVQSYNGALDFGLTACRKALPDLPELAKHIQLAHEELLRLTPAIVADNAEASAPAAPVKAAVKKAPAKKATVAKKVAAKKSPAAKPVPRKRKATA
ncbi:MAG: wax ester/triacylglycerol synthase family O-acyltransferase [Pseudomonadota bacterium]